MPNKDEKLWYKARLKREYREPLILAAKSKKISVQDALTEAVNKWLLTNES